MNSVVSQEEDDFSLFALGTILLRNLWRIVRWMLIGGVLAAISVVSKPLLYVASTSFVPQGSDQSRGGLSTLAGQFGVSLPASGSQQSPDFYVRLLRSRVLLEPIARKTFVVDELGHRPISFQELFGIHGGSERSREETAVEMLIGAITTSVARSTGVVDLTVATRWPSVSLAIATELVNGLNDYNRRTRQAQAEAERKFVEGQLSLASAELRAAEDRLEAFLRTNREFSSSPELAFQRDRLQRDVTLKQQVFTSLTQALEDVRIREVRDTPVISVIESPSVPTTPAPRGRVKRVLLGLILGGLFGAALALAAGITARGHGQGNPEVDEFFNTIGELKNGFQGRIGRIKKRFAR